MKKKAIDKNLIIFLIFFIIFVVSIFFNIMSLTKYPIVKYENDENIVFFGDSLTAGYDVKKFFSHSRVVNRGIGGNKTADLLDRIDKDVYDYNPSKVFLLIGINDLSANVDEDDLLFNINNIIKGIKSNRSKATIYVESLYPIGKEREEKEENKKKDNYNNASINKINEKIKKMCKEENVIYVNVHDSLTNKEGRLKNSYTEDGLHLSSLGYLKVTSVLREYVEK